jgi:hypothetical protein
VRPALWQIAGILLFLFIPLVLYLFVAHPAPVAASAGAGVLLMLGHRFLARPYLERVRLRKCLWCNRWLAPGAEAATVPLRAGGGELVFAACPGHEAPAERFLGWVDRLRLPLRLGIGLPLLGLLAALFVAAAGREAPVGLATDLFRFVVGLTVNVAALGPFAGPARGPGVPPHRAAFPPHNFSLLGVRAILWIFRIVGVYWLWTASGSLVERLAG